MKTALLVIGKNRKHEKVANAIKQGLEEAGIQVTMKKPRKRKISTIST